MAVGIARSREMEVDGNGRGTHRYGHWRGFVTDAIVCLSGPEMVRSDYR